jgi:transcriptional regulator with XRE-family HTH domain
MDRHEMNQVELAEMLGLTQASVSLFLAGHTRPKDDTVRRIAEGLGEDFDYLMGYKDTGSKGTGRIVGHILGKSTPEELELLRDIPDDDYHKMMGELALKYRGRRRKKPRSPLLILLLIGLGLAALDAIDDTFHRAGVAIFHDNAHGFGHPHVAHLNPVGADSPQTTPSGGNRRSAR